LNFASFNEAKEPSGQTQDSIFFSKSDDGGFVFALADGMGGRPEGALASRLAIKAVEEDWGRLKAKVDQRTFNKAASFIKDHDEVSGKRGMGTTLTIGAILEAEVKILHVGDCSVFHLRDNGIRKITKDQTEIEELIDQGVFPRSFARKYHRRHVLTSAITSDMDFSVLDYAFSYQVGDRIVAVTDGVTELITKREIRDISLSTNNASNFVDHLKDVIAEKGAVDDYACIAMFF